MRLYVWQFVNCPLEIPYFYMFPFPYEKSPSLTFPSWFCSPWKQHTTQHFCRQGQQLTLSIFSTLLKSTMSTTETYEQGDDRSSSTEVEVHRRPRRGGKGGHHKIEEPKKFWEFWGIFSIFGNFTGFGHLTGLTPRATIHGGNSERGKLCIFGIFMQKYTCLWMGFRFYGDLGF